MRENGFRAIGGLAQRLTSGIADHRARGGRGASIARLRAEWTAIVGPDLARLTRPEALLSGRGARAGKSLRLRVSPAPPLQVHHSPTQQSDPLTPTFRTRIHSPIR